MIPHIIHQIWLGGEPPEKVAAMMASVQRMHPDWQYRVWTDGNRPPLRNEAQFLAASSYAMKADLLRYELLLEFGGMYIDADFVCHRAVDKLMSETGRNRLLVSEFGVVCNGIMGAMPGDVFIRALVETAAVRFDAAQDKVAGSNPHLVTGPYLVDELFVSLGLNVDDPLCLLPGDYFFRPRTRVRSSLERSRDKRYMTHEALASWRRPSAAGVLKRSRLRTRLRRFFDLAAE